MLIIVLTCFTTPKPKHTFETPKIPLASYKILNPKEVDAQKEPKKIAQCIVDAVSLEAENYRLGNTKA
jgi:myosin heavy subunit